MNKEISDTGLVNAFSVAGLRSEWVNKETRIKLISSSIVTTVGNGMIAKIHNNPKLEGPRMPAIFPDELANDWIDPTKSQKELNDLRLPFPDDSYIAHTVYRIAKKESKVNAPEAEDAYIFEELKI